MKFVRSKFDLYVGFSGGYGELRYAATRTGESGLLRLSIGSLWRASHNLRLGSEFGFQTGSQMVLNANSTAVLGPNALPVFLIMKSPVDALLTMKYYIYDPAFIQVKAGYAYQGTIVNGADVITTNSWMPDIQAGAGIKLSDHCRFILNYQRFFGQKPTLIDMDPLTGVTTLKGTPTWQAVLLSVEINV